MSESIETTLSLEELAAPTKYPSKDTWRVEGYGFRGLGVKGVGVKGLGV